MSLKQQFTRQDIEWEQLEHEDGTELIADFGPGSELSADTVGQTVIVVTGDDQYEFTADSEVQAETNNGVLTVEVDR